MVYTSQYKSEHRIKKLPGNSVFWFAASAFRSLSNKYPLSLSFRWEEQKVMKKWKRKQTKSNRKAINWNRRRRKRQQPSGEWDGWADGRAPTQIQKANNEEANGDEIKILIWYNIETLAPKSQPQYAIHLTSCIRVLIEHDRVSYLVHI